MNICEKLLNITNELTNVAKNLLVGEGKSSYKAVGEADVLKAVRPLENKYKVYSYPVSRKVIESSLIESTNYKGEIVKRLFERIETTYRFVNVEDPKEYVDITSYGDGIDSGDKSVGKAMTYADKYALLKAYKIITGDDPDQNPSEQVERYVLSETLVNELKSMNITLEQIANYKGVSVNQLTNQILTEIIKKKKGQ